MIVAVIIKPVNVSLDHSVEELNTFSTIISYNLNSVPVFMKAGCHKLFLLNMKALLKLQV